jgi:PAS domain S-box-containing protein
VAPTPVSRTRAYSLAILTFGLAFLLRVGVDPWLGKSVPFILFFPAIMVAARYGGFGPGMLVTALSAGTTLVRYLEPSGDLTVTQPSDVLSLAIFGAVGALIASLSDTVRRAEADQWRLAAIVQSSDDAIVGKDLNGVITSWNSAAERLFGYRAAEALGRSIMMLIPPERRSEEDEVLQSIRAGYRIQPFETIRRRKDGTDVDVSVTVSPIVDGIGAIVGASKIVRDITERRRLERMRAELVERQRVASAEALEARDRLAFLSDVGALLASSLDYAETLDRAVHLALPRLGDYCNVLIQDDHGQLHLAAWGHVRRDQEPLLRELTQLVFDSAQTPRVPTLADRIMASGQTLVATSAMLAQAAAAVPQPLSPELIEIGRQLRPHAYVGVPLFVRGHAAGVLAFGTTTDDSRRDYTAADVALIEEFSRRVAVALENARLFRHADELNRFKDEFLATLSHELRTPLSAVLGWARMLGSGQLDAVKTRQAIEAIERNAQAQARIVDDILDVARGREGSLRLEMTRFDLLTAVNRAVEAVMPTALAKQIQVDMTAAQSVPLVGDPNRLQQVVWNLMSNAVKFTPGGGMVTVALAAVDGHAELRVSDNGAGIPANFLPFVFDKFRQADASFTRQHGGLGLGLAIARHLTELHGGSIDAHSAGEGSGATFVVRLPLPAPGVS